MSLKKYMGIILITLSAFFFTLMNIFVRLSGDLPSPQKSFFRNLVALFVALVILVKNKTPVKPQSQKNLPALLARSLFGTLGVLCNFYAVDHLVLSDASMLNKMSPFYVVLFSMLFLKEKTTPFQLGTVALALVGAVFVIKPSFENVVLVPALVGFLGGIFAGIAYTSVRYLTTHGEKSPFIVLFFSAFSCLFTLPFLVADYHPMRPAQLLFLLLAGTCATCAQFALTYAYSYAPAKEISVFDYSQIIFSSLFGLLLFNQIPDFYSIIGYAIVILAAVSMFLYNNHRSKDDT